MLDDDLKIIRKNPNLDKTSKTEQIENYKNIYKNYDSLFNEKNQTNWSHVTPITCSKSC